MTPDNSTSTMDEPTTGTETHPLAEAGQEATESAGHIAGRAADLGIQQADRGRELAADGLDKVASTVRRLSTDMQIDQPQIANAAMTAADKADDVARYLRETDARQIISNVEDTARRQRSLHRRGFLLGPGRPRLIKAGSPDTAQARQFERSGTAPAIRARTPSRPPAPGRATDLRHPDMDQRDESRGIGDLLGDLGRHVSTLVRKEIDLARVEVTSSVGRLSRGAAMAGAGGAVLYAGLLVLLLAIVLGLIQAGIDAWLAALIVAVVVVVSVAWSRRWA